MGSLKEQRMTGNDPRNESDDETGNDPGSAKGPQLEVSADEDWKNRVKAEDAAFDQKFTGSETASAKTAASGSAGAQRATNSESSERQPLPQFPEPTFATLLAMLSTQAMVALGLIPNPATRKAEKELPLARYFIDLISVLEQKTAGNLDSEEAAALEESLHTLRMVYVQRSKETP
jgi:hypothetical protein